MKSLKSFRYGERGFTLIELLIIIAILGIMAVVVVPNLVSFLGSGNVAAANTEAANVETAALAYYADNNGAWPTPNSDVLYSSGNSTSYLSGQPKAVYTFNSYGKIDLVTSHNWPNIQWNTSTHQWEKIP